MDGLFASILQMLNMAELGFSSAIVFSMYRPLAVRDTETVCALLAFYRRVYRVIGGVVLCLGLALFPFLPRLVSGDVPPDVDLYVLYAIFLGNTVIGYYLYAYKRSLLLANQRSNIVSNVDSVLQLLRFGVQGVLVLVLHSYYLYVLTLPLFTVLTNVVIEGITRRAYPMYSCHGKIAPAMMRDIRKRVAGLLIFRLCTVSRNGFDSLFLSIYLGLTTVAIYNNYFLILTGLTSVMGVVSQAVSASVGNSIAMESVEKNYHDFARFNFLYMMASGLLTVLLLVLYQPFMIWWLGEDFLLPMPVVAALCAYFYVLKMGDVRAIYNDAAGLWWEQRHRTLLEAIANVALNYVLIQLLGVLGVVLASLLSLFFIGFLGSAYITFRCYFGRARLMPYLREQGRYAGGMLVLGGVCWYACESLLPGASTVDLILRAALAAGMTGGAMLAIGKRTAIGKSSLAFLRSIRRA